MNTIYNTNNLEFNNYLTNISPDIIYADPPYNTGNQFKYNDNLNNWNLYINELFKNVSEKLLLKGVFIVSISEDSLLETMNILKSNFKYLYEPLIWLTKNPLNQNKVTKISAICHEYILIVSNIEIKTNTEKYSLFNSKEGIEKIKNYPYIIEELNENKISNNISSYDYTIKRHNNEFAKDFNEHIFQKRTIQKGHGSERYIKKLKELSNYNENTLYSITTKDKQGLGKKYILGNSYFQSVSSTFELKVPSFLGLYQPGIKGFQTAKPIELMQRIFKLFEKEKDTILVDLFLGSGNCTIAAKLNKYQTYSFEENVDIYNFAVNNINRFIK